jgi:acetyl esterase/lipase
MVLIHGGFWRDRFALDLMEPLAADLVVRGWVAVNVEYRRLGQLQVGWPMLLTDVAAALDSVPALLGDLDLEAATVVVTGHSAGGQLALWSGGRHLLPAGAPGADPVLRPDAVVGLAAVSDLHAAAALGLSSSVVLDLLGGTPDEVPDRYDLASPAALAPTGTRQLVVHGELDDVVPADMSAGYAAAAAAAGDPVELVTDPGADHFTVIDPGSALWDRTMEGLDAG